MSTIRAIIIDDEPLAHRIIERYTADISFLEIVGQYFFATDAYTILTSGNVDLIFLDIQMPKLNGMDFLRTLTNPPKVIITSAFEEYALGAFELQVSDYLLKPFSFERFLKAVNVVRFDLESRIPLNAKPENLFIKVDKRQVKINSRLIYCLESYGNYVKIWVEQEMYLTPRTLASFEDDLPGTSFQRVHKSFVVNIGFVDYVEGNTIYMKNAMQIPIGKNYRNSIRTWFK